MSVAFPTCENPECHDGWVWEEDVEQFQGGYMPTGGAVVCPDCISDVLAWLQEQGVGEEVAPHIGSTYTYVKHWVVTVARLKHHEKPVDRYLVIPLDTEPPKGSGE